MYKFYCSFHNGTKLTGSIIIVNEISTYEYLRGTTINHDYNLKAVSGGVVVVDNATGLMWHQSGSDDWMRWDDAKEWVED